MRGKPAQKRKILPDPKYNSPEVAKFINYIMQGGKKTLAQKIVYQTFEIIARETKENPIEVFNKAMENISPLVELRSRRIGGANYQIPTQTSPSRRFILASRWIIEAARARRGKSMSEKLAQEFLDVLKSQGAAMKKKEDTYRMAEANKAFAHFARFH